MWKVWYLAPPPRPWFHGSEDKAVGPAVGMTVSTSWVAMNALTWVKTVHDW